VRKIPFRENQQLQVFDFIEAKITILMVVGFSLMTTEKRSSPLALNEFPSGSSRLIYLSLNFERLTNFYLNEAQRLNVLNDWNRPPFYI
jgi:hypothetical protein